MQLIRRSDQSPNDVPNRSTKKSSAFFNTWASFSLCGTFQLFTSHHHFRILAPSFWPWNLLPRFQCRQPNMIRFQRMPCVRGRKTWSRIVMKATFQLVSAFLMLARYDCSKRKSGMGGNDFCRGRGWMISLGIVDSEVVTELTE